MLSWWPDPPHPARPPFPSPLPGLWAEVKRYTDVTVEFLDETGTPKKMRARGLLAKAFQHEVDHLDGKLFIDLVDPKSKPELKKVIKKLRSQWD